uniref:Uncharacterized protein n=1 Tax=Sipha flava TaxID=143950 RepID=A0A2S2R6B9_9HEMI
MSKLATNRRILIMAMAAILLPFAMISASPTERNTTETQDIKITDTTTEYPTVSINNDTLLPTSIECYCNLPECLSTSGSYNPCTTRLGCFFELQPADILKSNKTRNPLSEDQFSTVFIEDYKVNGVFGCLESSPVYVMFIIV